MKKISHVSPTQKQRGWPLRSAGIKWLAAFGLVLLLTLSGRAQGLPTLTWDPGNTNDGPTIETGSGGWDTDTTTNLNWNNGTTNVHWTQTSTTSALNCALFTGPDGTNDAYQVTMDGTQIAVSNITVKANGYVFSGATIWNPVNTILTIADGKSVTFNNNFAQNNVFQAWQLGSNGPPATMTVNGNIGGIQLVFNSTNGSTFYLAGATAASVTTIDANVWQTNGTASIGANTWQVGRSVTGSGGNSKGVFVLDGPNTVQTYTTGLQISRGGGNGTVIVQDSATMNIGTTVSTAQNIQIESELANNSHGAFYLFSGTVNLGQVGSSTANGQILLNRSGSDPGSTAVYWQTGGVMNAWGGILIGAASGTFTGGTAAFTNSGGFLYIGSGGISHGAVYAPTNYFVLSGGTVGCLGAGWISSIPMTLDVVNGNITFQSADVNNTPYNISLSGALTGPGGLYKTGPGILTLSGTNNYAGSTVVSNGTLLVKTANFPTNGPVTLDGSAGNPVASVSVVNAGQYWSMGSLTYASGTPVADFNYGSFIPSTTIAPIQVNGNVAFTVAPQITVEGSNILSGTYPLIQYSGTVSGTPPTALVSLPAGVTNASIVNDTAHHSIDLVIGSSINPPLTWRVGNGTWDFTTANWSQVGNPVLYRDGLNEVLDDTASGASPIDITLNTIVQPGGVSAQNATKAYVISGTGSLAGQMSLAVSGAAGLTLNTTNTYTGGTTVSAPGQLNINNGGDGGADSAIGSGPFTVNTGAKIDNTSGRALTLLTSIQQNWNDDWTFIGSTNLNLGLGPVTMGNSLLNLTVVSNTLEVDGPISDNGNNYKLLKLGAGALTLGTDSSFGGGFELVSGTLNIASANCLGSGIFTIDGGTIDNTSGQPLVMGSFPSVSITLAQGGTFTFLGSSSLDLGSAPINPNNGTQMYWNVVSNSLTMEGPVLSGNTTITKIGAGTLVLSGFTADQFTGVIDQGELDLDNQGGVSIGSGGQGLLIQSNAICRITGASGNEIYHGGFVQTRLSTGGVLDLDGQNQAIDMLGDTNGVLEDSMSNSVSMLTVSPTAGVHDNSINLNGTNCQFYAESGSQFYLNSVIDGSGNFVKTGLGTLFDGTNLFTGAMLIDEGTVMLTDPNMVTNTPLIHIYTGATLDASYRADQTVYLIAGQTLLGGGGINGTLITAPGSVVAPGPSGIIGDLMVTNGDQNSITVDGTLLLNLDRTNAQTSSQLVAVNGTVTYGGILAVTNIGPALHVGDVFHLFPSAMTTFTGFNFATADGNGMVYTWNNNVGVDGSISVASVAPAVNANAGPIQFSLSNGTLSLSWPTNLGWILQSQTNSIGAGLQTSSNAWFDVTGSGSVTSTNLPVNPANPTVFYRLRRPY